ncbi:hypothetical protein CC1G_07618 [Coprinopsis cinerea okayama7|uniref:Uncharacterized protein n=1 Tax=Coprinopsis cinerea (strain Okayama-7 / 130 / ATCC MYA-4618 / FGSC 9003) TaxID=240176 RepID=A8NC14_COPC7|nr:hypothetical protein CC1G_07618 [Coprinopsis cinerea okayama7\|eukprot:XP_001832358.2 hypothetical protein CC1G_07618 [Coprinopsis cinerea okayama7\
MDASVRDKVMEDPGGRVPSALDSLSEDVDRCDCPALHGKNSLFMDPRWGDVIALARVYRCDCQVIISLWVIGKPSLLSTSNKLWKNPNNSLPHRFLGRVPGMSEARYPGNCPIGAAAHGPNFATVLPIFWAKAHSRHRCPIPRPSASKSMTLAQYPEAPDGFVEA